MSWKTIVAIIAVASVIVAGTIVVTYRFTANTTVAPKKSESFPQPYIVYPRADDSFPGYPAVIWGDRVHVMALEMNLSTDILWTRFEYSVDASQWKLIAIDTDPLGTMNFSHLPGQAGLFGGFLGWDADWDTSGLAEGNYSLRATMKNRAGNLGSLEMKVSFDRTPPIPRIYARYHEAVRGNHSFGLDTADEDVLEVVAHFWSGSNASHDQGPGVGGLKQDQLGPTGNPPQGGSDNMFCGPMAAANGLMRLGQKDPRILNGADAKNSPWTAFIDKNIKDYLAKYPDDPKDSLDRHDEVKSFYDNQTKSFGPYVKDGKLTNLGLAMVLACKMRTDIDNGTSYENLRAGLEEFLKEQGIDGNYTVSGWDADDAVAAGTQNGSAWENLTREIRKNETVIINIYYSSDTQTDVHSLTAKDFKVRQGQKGPPKRSISVVDPRGGEMELPYGQDDDGNGYVVYKGHGYYIINITSVSPDDFTRGRYYVATFLPVRPSNFDDNGGDGWAVSWDTSTVHDGFYIVRAMMVDGRGNIGSSCVEVIVDNLVPAVRLMQPQNRSVIGGATQVRAMETTGSEDIESMLFSYSPGGQNWTVIGEDAEGSDGWGIIWNAGGLPPGSYLLKASTLDYAGNEGWDIINVTVQG